MSARTPDATRRRKERANVEHRLQGVFLKADRLHPSQELRVLNVSELGLGVELPEDVVAPNPGDVIEGKLMVGRTVAPVRLRFVHLGKGTLGLEFLDPSALLRGAIQQYFQPELVGASLRPNGVTQGPMVKKRVYVSTHSESAKDRLEVSLGIGGAIDRFLIRVLGNAVEWDAIGGLRLVQNSRAEPLPDYLRNQLIKLIQSADAVDEPIRKRVEAVLAGTSADGTGIAS